MPASRVYKVRTDPESVAGLLFKSHGSCLISGIAVCNTIFRMAPFVSLKDKRMSRIDKNILSLQWSEKMSLPMRDLPDRFQL